MIIESTFKPAWWLANPHIQTVYPTMARRAPASITQMERFELEDGDFLDLAWACGDMPADTPLVILLHGLGGGLHSAYVSRLLSAFNQAGWRGVLMHFRGASGELNRLSRVYHSGDTGDLKQVVKALSLREPTTKKAIVGISLGGNVLLKWLAEAGKNSLIEAGVAVSVPFQLNRAADRMNRGLSRLYQQYLLREMRALFQRKCLQHDNHFLLSVEKLNSSKCFWTFDENITAPLHGFSNVHEYYRYASSRQYLGKIDTPALILHAKDDPFMTPDVIPEPGELSDVVTLELSEQGGHVGFISGHIPGKPLFWLDHRIPEYLSHYL